MGLAAARPRGGAGARRAARARAPGATRVGYLPEHPYLYDYLTAGRVPRLRGAPLRPAARRGGASGTRELLALVGPRALGRRPDAALLEGHGAAGGPRPGPRQRPRAADPRRADVGPRPDRPAPRARPHPRRSARRARPCFFSTHILSDAETLCDRVAVLRAGRLLKVGPLGELLRLDVAHMEVLVSGVAARRARPRRPLDGASARGRAAAARGRRRARSAASSPRSRRPGGRVLSVQPVRQTPRGLLLPRDGRRPQAGGARRWGGGMSRLLAVAANTFRETVRERVLYNLVFFAILMTLSGLLLGPALDPPGREDHQGHRPRRDGPLRHADRGLHRGRAREQGDRAPLALPAAREAALARRVLPRQVRGPGLHAARQRRP